jgi:ribosomal-protein-alanine N-acetyltransferase
MTAFVIAPALPRDAERLYEVECASFAVPWSRQSLMSFIENSEHAHCIKAGLASSVCETAEGTKEEFIIVGYIGIMHVLDEGEISNIAVHPDYRGQGAGFQLLTAALEYCRNAGIKTLHLEVRPSNSSALALYSKCGFVRSGLRRGYYADNCEDALLYAWYDKS